LISVQIDLLQHLTPQRARAAAEIAKPRAGHEVDEAMESQTARAVEPGTAARPAPADGYIAGSECGGELADVLRLDLVIGGEGQDGVTRAALEAGVDCGRGGEAASQRHDRDRLAGAHQLIEAAARVRQRAVQDENELVRKIDRLDARLVLPVQLLQLAASGANRNDDRQKLVLLRLHALHACERPSCVCRATSAPSADDTVSFTSSTKSAERRASTRCVSRMNSRSRTSPRA